MINTFWNLCRTCPIPAESKLHAEYKRSFAWQPGHPESSGDAIVKPPDATVLEPALPRRKKHPEVAYRTSEILGCDTSRRGDQPGLRARPEERSNKNKVGSRSRSADPSLGRPVMSNPHGGGNPETSEYRAAFAWPPKPTLPPAPQQWPQVSTEPAAAGACRVEQADKLVPRDETVHDTKRHTKRTEYKAKFKPFSTYMYVDGTWKKPKSAVPDVPPPVVDPNSWYTEVVERLQMADEFRSRSRAGALQSGDVAATHGLGRTGELWSRLDSSNSLAALALAQTPRLSSAKTLPKDRPVPSSIYRSPSAKRRENAERSRTADASDKKSPTKPVSPVKAEVQASASKHAAKTSPPPKTHATRPPLPKVTGKGEDGGESNATPRARAASSPPQRRVPIADQDKKEEKKSGSSRPRRPLQESAAPPPAKPRAVVRPASAAVNDQDGKIWLKPQGSKPGEDEQVHKEGKSGDEGELVIPPVTTPAESVEAATPGSERKSDAVRPSSLPPMNGSSASSSALGSADLASPSPLPEPQGGPVPLTTVKSPEEMTGVKSPDPETWTVPLDTGRGLEWTDGQSPAGDWPGKAKSSAPAVTDPNLAPKIEPLIPENKVDPIQKVAVEEGHKGPPDDAPVLKATGGSGADVLDKARNRLDEFWVTGK